MSILSALIAKAKGQSWGQSIRENIGGVVGQVYRAAERGREAKRKKREVILEEEKAIIKERGRIREEGKAKRYQKRLEAARKGLLPIPEPKGLRDYKPGMSAEQIYRRELGFEGAKRRRKESSLFEAYLSRMPSGGGAGGGASAALLKLREKLKQ